MLRLKGKSKNKYGAKGKWVDGEWYASQKEYRRWCELQLLEKSGAIANLRKQVTVPLRVNDVLVCTIRLDAVYFDKEKGKPIFEDTKGWRTPAYRIKKKLFEALFRGRTISEY